MKNSIHSFDAWVNQAQAWGWSLHGSELSGPCPVCGGHDRFHIKQTADGTGLVGCRGCIDGQAPQISHAAYRAIAQRVFATDTPVDPPVHRSGPTTTHHIEQAQRLNQAVVEAHDTPVMAYLAHRLRWPTVWKDAVAPGTVGWIPRDRYPYVPEDAAGAMVCRYMRDDGSPHGTLTGLSLEALTAAGEQTRPRWRRSRGIKNDAVFQTNWGDGVVVVCEGEISAIAGSFPYQDADVVCTGGAQGLQSWRPNRWQSGWRVVIEADPDEPGLKAAYALQRALEEQGILTHMETRPQQDLADYVVAAIDQAAHLRVEAGDAPDMDMARVWSWEQLVGTWRPF